VDYRYWRPNSKLSDDSKFDHRLLELIIILYLVDTLTQLHTYFGSTYLCEMTFFHSKVIKVEYRAIRFLMIIFYSSVFI